MKLRIRFLQRVWCCCYVDPDTGLPILPWGHGYSPSDAFKEWQAIREGMQ